MSIDLVAPLLAGLAALITAIAKATKTVVELFRDHPTGRPTDIGARSPSPPKKGNGRPNSRRLKPPKQKTQGNPDEDAPRLLD